MIAAFAGFARTQRRRKRMPPFFNEREFNVFAFRQRYFVSPRFILRNPCRTASPSAANPASSA